MANIDVDTAKLYDYGTDIINKAQECNQLLNEVYNDLTKIEEFAWAGKAADTFSKKTLVKKTDAKKLINALIMYGKVMRNSGARFDQVVKKLN